MASEIRVNSLTNRSGLSTVSITDTGAVISGIVTVSDTINAQSNINVSTNLSVSGVSTLGNTVVGGATTELIVGGDARITGILTIGTSSITLDGSNNTITSSNFVGNLSGNVVTTGVSTFKSLDYAGISSTISDTAVDIFVYDTSKDSDGGAWRYKTQRTSWYNETLNTATRGSRREFPAVAVIVAESTQVTIYDGDDPDMPMWMVFNQGSSQGNNFMLNRFMGNIKAISMLNGNLFISINSTSSADRGGTLWVNFISEISYASGTSDAQSENIYGFLKHNIAQRNSVLGTNVYGDKNSKYQLVDNGQCNDVAMTVLPNAPIDSATGLPIPTIAVATYGGVSVIKDDGNVVDITAQSGAGYSPVSGIDITENYHLIFEQDTAGRAFFCIPIPSADRITATNDGSIVDKVVMKYYSAGTHIPYPCFLGSGVDYAVSLGEGDNQAIVSTTGDLTILHPNFDNPEQGKVAYATTSYNTGWMHGDIKGAFLSGISTASVTGTELVTNGSSGFSGTSGWYLDDTNSTSGTVATIAESSGTLVFTHGSTTDYWDGFGVSISTVIGKSYVILADIAVSTDMNSIRITNTASQHDTSPYNPGGFNSAGEHQYTFIATATTTYIHWNGYASTATMTLNSFSVRLADPDRSVNNKGLQVFGTINKSAVAGSGDTAAELVAYSGFSASNYLIQPYNSDLDFGTGDLSIMFWYKSTSGSSQCLLHRGDGVAGGGGWGSQPIIQIEFNGTNLAAFLSDAAFGSYDTIGIPIATSANSVWNHYVLTRSGGTMGVYFNGSLYGSTSSTRTLTNTAAKTWIGERPNATRPATNTSLALYRMGASAPSVEQVKKIYEDEKVLFQENAACTLYGSSDAVTALAYDEVNDLLHVGTSSGRSDFNGLRRINNTTTAVTTAISAYDGLIAAQ